MKSDSVDESAGMLGGARGASSVQFCVGDGGGDGKLQPCMH